MNSLKVAYNDSLRMVLGIQRYCSASEMFAYTNVPSCQCVIRLNIYSFMKRIQCMNNEIVHSTRYRTDSGGGGCSLYLIPNQLYCVNCICIMFMSMERSVE